MDRTSKKRGERRSPGATPSLRELLRTAIWALQMSWRAHPGLTLTLLLLTIVMSVLPALLLLTMRNMVDAVVVVVDSGQAGLAPILPWLAAGLVLTVLQGLGNYGQDYAQLLLEDKLTIKATVDVLAHAAAMEVAFFEDTEFQDRSERAQQNVGVNLSGFVNQLLGILSRSIEAITMLYILLPIEPILGVILLLALPPFIFFHWRLARADYSQEIARTTKRRWTRYFVDRLTRQQYVPEVRILGLGPHFVERYSELMEDIRDQSARIYRRRFQGSMLFTTFATAVFFGTFVDVALKAIQGLATVGDVMVYGASGNRLRGQLEGLVTTSSQALRRATYISAVRDFLNAPRAPDTTRQQLPLPVSGALELRHVTFTYPGSRRPAVLDISLSIRAGETVALVGENGSGKTTLAKLISRLYVPQEGEILLDGVDLQSVSPFEVYRQVSLVFQDFGRYEATVADNIAYGDWERLHGDREQIEAIASRAEVAEMVEAMPAGYETLLGRMFGTYTPSGGQWQKIAIARAFARQAAILILDEPTANLDSRAEFGLFSKFRELAEGRTTLLISHRFSTVNMADRIVVLLEGQIVEAGTHTELLSKGGHYARLYELHHQLLDTRKPTELRPARGGSRQRR
jgi:ATP-binding cassette subfamily B protein